MVEELLWQRALASLLQFIKSFILLGDGKELPIFPSFHVELQLFLFTLFFTCLVQSSIYPECSFFVHLANPNREKKAYVSELGVLQGEKTML